MKALLEFVVGAAVIVNSQYQVPVLAGSVALKLGRVLARRLKRRRRSRRGSATGDHESSVELEWSRLSVGITHKKTGQQQQIFRDLDGLAQPGRLNASYALSTLPGHITTLVLPGEGQAALKHQLPVTRKIPCERLAKC